ncbi:glycosyltransferase [Candidatus Scalindua japonica]|uniref:Glycosyltransferase n=1 Tax=Candidatus Scalindua japonica TaxID=1284222 RepID=A0A286TVV1_9BACT|nr:glycosyltransferase [Candidatus Scalindua japonica]GAX60013.1 glycosyltransferase [Candidatus Scalindua japonica]
MQTIRVQKTEIQSPKPTGRIIYVNYDSLEPSGGVKVIYSHVLHLVNNGYPAFVLHTQKDFRIPWLECDVPILYAKDNLRISPNDIVVIPEDHNTALNVFKNIQTRKFVFCQNHYYIFNGLQNNDSWRNFGVTGIFCCSSIISDFISEVFGYSEVPVIHNAIPLDLFEPRNKKLQIAYMPRKIPGELNFIRNLFKKLYKQYDKIPWICIDKVKESKVAEIMNESAVFLSTSTYEGFGLPPIEAMASGCIVVGFHGDGGLEYASEDNGFWCEWNNITDCAKTLGQVITLIENDDEVISKKRGQAIKTAGEYSYKRQEKDLLNYWSDIYK